tara:strand:+ start:781 stop:1113 length:333 start_codon:yes stop_codon:yes gene_type:complete
MKFKDLTLGKQLSKIENICIECELEWLYDGMKFIGIILFNPEKLDKEDKDEIAYVANIFDCGEYDVFIGSTHYYKRGSIDNEKLSADFNDYIRSGKVPWQVRNWCRNYLS